MRCHTDVLGSISNEGVFSLNNIYESEKKWKVLRKPNLRSKNASLGLFEADNQSSWNRTHHQRRLHLRSLDKNTVIQVANYFKK